MGKIKRNRQYPFPVKIQFWIAEQEEEVHKSVIDFMAEKEYITFDDILFEYQRFLEQKDINYQTDMYYVPQDDHLPHEKLTPQFTISVDKVEQVGFLFILGKSRLFQMKLELQDEVRQLRRQLQNLQQQVKQLRDFKMEFQFYKKNSFAYNKMLSHTQSFHQNNYQTDNTQIDIAVLFSQPLYNDENRMPTLQPVDFRSQIARLKLALQDSYTPFIRMRCEIGRTETLRNIIRLSKPKIIHIICHGTEQGWIQLQDNSIHNLGFVNYVKPDDIKRILKDSLDSLPDLVFVNSCHSQKIGKAFYQIGVKIVVMINSQDLINDQAAQLFSENFYRNIYKGETVKRAFELAKDTVQKTHYSYGCCCSSGNHGKQQPHRQNCRWATLITKKYPNPHKIYHVPSTSCSCPLRNFNRHKNDCQWAKKVLFEINQDYRKKVGEKQIFPPKQNEYPEYYDREKKQFFICCCPYTDRKPHNECYKFKIQCKQQYQNHVFSEIYSQNQAQLQDLTPAQLSQSVFKSKNIYGRQKQLYTFLKMFRENIFMLISGISGVGLTSFAVKAASYAIQRKICEYYFFIDLYEIKQQTVFRFKFNQTTGFKYSGSGTISHSGIKSKKMLILFDNCDQFLKHAEQQFYKQLNTLHKQLPRAKFIFILKQENLTFINRNKLLFCHYQLQPLQLWFAKSYLLTKLKDKTDMSVGFLQCGKLVRNYPVLTIPKIIESLSQSLQDNQNRGSGSKKATYQVIVKNIQQITQFDDNQLTNQVLQNLKQLSNESYELLIFISQFSDGVSSKDLDMFSSYDRKYSKFRLPVKQDWRDHINVLLSKNNLKNSNSQSDSSDDGKPKIMTSITTYKDSCLEIKDDQYEITEQQKSHKRKKSYLSDYSTDIQIKQESYFLQKISNNKFVVKRFIRDFVWNKYKNSTTNKMKFLYIVYFSVILELLFENLRKQNIMHQQLLTYSAVSLSGIFSYDTSIQSLHQRRSMTESTRIAKTIISQLQKTFSDGEILESRFKKSDPTTFVMNHKQDFLKIYDLDWNKYISYDRKTEDSSSKKEQEIRAEDKLVLFLLQNLTVYIPTAFKIARKKTADDIQLIQYVLSRSNNALQNLRKNSKDLLRSLKIQLKVHVMEIGIILETHQKRKKQQNIEQIHKIQQKAASVLMKCEKVLKDSKQFQEIKLIFNQEINNSQLYLNWCFYDQKEDSYETIRDRVATWKKQQDIQPILMSKQALLLQMLYYKYISTVKVHSIIHRKNRDKFFASILQLCQLSSFIFQKNKCKKLRLKAELTSIQIYWKYRNRIQYQQMAADSGIDHKQIDEWRIKLLQCEKFYLDSSNKLGSFPQFDDVLKSLKKQIKQKLWKLAQNTIIFMKAYPLCSDQIPIVSNLIRKKNNFRKDIEAILSEKVSQISSSHHHHHDSSLKHKQSFKSKKQKQAFTLDISTKFEILTYNKLRQQTQTGCSIMVLSCDFRQVNQKLYMIVEGQYMNEDQIEINYSFAANFTTQKLYVLIVCGENAKKAIDLISKLSKSPPVMIALDNHPEQNLAEIRTNIQISSQWIRSAFLQESEIRSAQLTYVKAFIKRLTRKKIQSINQVREIHEKALQKLRSLKTQKVHAIISYKNSQKFYLAYKVGSYRDLSPGYESNNNIDQKFFDQRVILRRWKKMIQVLKYLKGQRDNMSSFMHKKKSNQYDQSESQAQSLNNNMFQGFRNLHENKSQEENSAAFINIYGQSGSGKSHFIKQISRILVERELYNYGVFLFEGKKIEVKYSGDFESYITEQSQKNKMPNLQDFQKILGQNLILIIDDFNFIKPRSNARMKMFIDKILQKKVNLILVSTAQLNLDWIAPLKKIKLQKLDEFQTELLAYNILNIHNTEQINQYQKLKKGTNKVTIQDIKRIAKNKRWKKQQKKDQIKDFKKTYSFMAQL